MPPKVQLVLRSADINPAIRTYTGNAPSEPLGGFTADNGSYINRFRTDMMFAQIPLRTVLGQLYEEGAKYMLKLESISFHLSSNLSIFTGLEQERSWNVYLSGMPFMRSWNNGAVTDEVLLTSLRVPSGGATNNFYFSGGSHEFTFDMEQLRYSDFVNLRIQLRDQLTNTIEPNSNYIVAVPNSQYVFSIYKAE